MYKRAMHCIVTAIVSTLIALAIALAFPHDAHAMPRAWRNAPTTTQQGITYRVKGTTAVVTSTKGANVSIPAEIKYRGRWYEVKAIWGGALKGARVVTIHADLETCESSRPWVKGVKVRVTRAGMYRWFKSTGANVTRIHCSSCK